VFHNEVISGQMTVYTQHLFSLYKWHTLKRSEFCGIKANYAKNAQ